MEKIKTPTTEVVEIDGETYPIDLSILEIPSNPTLEELNSIAAEHPMLYASYGHLLAKAHLQQSAMEAKRDRVWAELYLDAKKFGVPGLEKVIENTIESYITTHPRWIEAEEKVASAKFVTAIVQSVVTALAKRGDIISTLSANVRPTGALL